MPAALFLRVKMPPHRDVLPVATLGICFFGFFFVLYNIAVSYTTAARASLALATLPLQTMVVGALLRIEPLTYRKTFGVCVAVFGVVAALGSGISSAPRGAWRGELIMTGAVLCMAFYNVWSRPFIQRSSALGFLTVGMGAGAITLVAIGLLTGRVAVLGDFGVPQWLAGIYLGVGGGGARFCPMGISAPKGDANSCSQYDDCQPGCGRTTRRVLTRRTDNPQSDRRPSCSVLRPFDRDNRVQEILTRPLLMLWTAPPPAHACRRWHRTPHATYWR